MGSMIIESDGSSEKSPPYTFSKFLHGRKGVVATNKQQFSI
jgi:hypothetical protein